VKKECRLKGGAKTAPPIPISPAVRGFLRLSKRCCKFKNGAVLGAVVEHKTLKNPKT